MLNCIAFTPATSHARLPPHVFLYFSLQMGTNRLYFGSGDIWGHVLPTCCLGYMVSTILAFVQLFLIKIVLLTYPFSISSFWRVGFLFHLGSILDKTSMLHVTPVSTALLV